MLHQKISEPMRTIQDFIKTQLAYALDVVRWYEKSKVYPTEEGGITTDSELIEMMKVQILNNLRNEVILKIIGKLES